jgi:hypothetical protein
MFVRYLFSGHLSDSASDQIFFSRITDLRFWRDAEKYSRGLVYLKFSLVDYGLVCATIEHVAMPREVNQNSSVMILLIIANHQSFLISLEF